jgi:hypothetical protein
VLKDFAPSGGLGWRLRVEILRDFAEQIKILHANDKTHNALHVDSSLIVVVGSFQGVLADETEAVSANTLECNRKRDVLMLGRLMLAACCGEVGILCFVI